MNLLTTNMPLFKTASSHSQPIAAKPLHHAMPLYERKCPLTSAVLLQMFDEIDYGVALVTVSGALRYANQLALQALRQGGALQLCHDILSASQGSEQAQLRSALADAARGLRRLLHLGEGSLLVSIAVLPLTPDNVVEEDLVNAAPPLAMLVFGRRQASETLTIDMFARTQKLTPAETAVLRALCAGQRPKEIANDAGVAVSTVRTQINNIRFKTQTSSIRELVERVATLPPITHAMKTAVRH